jgi:hypothetical protein
LAHAITIWSLIVVGSTTGEYDSIKSTCLPCGVPQITSLIFNLKTLSTSVDLISGISCDLKTLVPVGKFDAGTGSEKTAIF